MQLNLLRTHSVAPRESTTLVDKSKDHAKPHSIFFYHNIKDSEINICLDSWKLRLGLESARAALCKWAACTRQTFLSKTFSNSLNVQKKYEKNVWETSNGTHLLSARVQTTINHISIFFYHNINVKENVFLQSASLKRYCVTHWREQRGMDSQRLLFSQCLNVML